MTRYRLAPDVLRAPLHDEEVLLNTGTGMYHLLNATGRAVLGAIEAGSPLAEAAAGIAERTGADAGTVLSDVESFATELVARGLLEEDGDG